MRVYVYRRFQKLGGWSPTVRMGRIWPSTNASLPTCVIVPNLVVLYVKRYEHILPERFDPSCPAFQGHFSLSLSLSLSLCVFLLMWLTLFVIMGCNFFYGRLRNYQA